MAMVILSASVERFSVSRIRDFYILVQLTAHVSLSGLPVLSIRYTLTPMHKRTNTQNCECCVFIKIVALKKNIFFIFFIFGPSKKWIYCSKAKLISLYRGHLFTFTHISRHIKWKLWTSIKVSRRLGKHLSICFLILLFFLQFAEFNLKAPPYSKMLHYSRISISRALPPFRSIYSPDRGNSSRGNVANWKCEHEYFLFYFFYYCCRYY